MTILPNKSPEDYKLEDLFNIAKPLGKGGGLLDNIFNIALALGGGIAVIFLLVGAFWYFTAFGNEEKANKGKTTIMWAIIGIAVILLSQVIVYTLRNLLM